MRSRTSRIGDLHGLESWVGGRQDDPAQCPKGGGYLDSCNTSWGGMARGARDPRLSDLRALGIGERWLRIAREIGVDEFLTVWRILDEANEDGFAGARVRVPLFRSWERRLRNRYILALAASGSGAREIRRRLLRERCEELSERHIHRIIAQGIE